MEEIEQFPHEVDFVDNTFIELPDGVRLAARLWIPSGAQAQPCPAIFEFVPYGKSTATEARDAINHGFFAGHGYACVRVDLRGSGDSEGTFDDEYSPQELDDAETVIRWIRAQDWCDGNVGMMGISWGGFNALQVAARRPPGLGAIITVCSTDDRYADDVHYMGGCLLGDNLSWASTMFSYAMRPPDPRVVGEQRWRELWKQRLEHGSIWLTRWLVHQRRDAYWRHGSICENYEDIEIPVFAVSGWADGYSNAVFRMLEHLSCPRLGLVGPWGHKYPHQGVPGPAIGFLQEALRFWDESLKGVETGIFDEPMLRAWLQDSVEPSTAYAERPGRWVAEESWPPETAEVVTMDLVPYTLVPRPHDEVNRAAPIALRSPLTLGEFAGKWCSFSALPQLPSDQRQEDGGALVFDSEPLEEDVEILGAPEIELELESDHPVAMLAARISDVQPKRAATRVTYGVLNLTHRDGHDDPKPLEVGERVRVTIRLNHIAHRFPAGHRIRLALSTSYWPLIWVPPEPATLTIHTRDSSLRLPVRRRHGIEAERPVRFEKPVGAPPPARTQLTEPEHSWRVIRELAVDHSTHEVVKDSGRQRLDQSGLELRQAIVERYSIHEQRADSARGETVWTVTYSRPGQEGEPDWEIRLETRMVLTSDREHFYIDADLDAFEGARRFHAGSVHETVRRDLL